MAPVSVGGAQNPREISRRAISVQTPPDALKRLLIQRRAAWVRFAAATALVTWASNTQALPDQARRATVDAQHATAVRNAGFGGAAVYGDATLAGRGRETMRLAQAATEDSSGSRRSTGQEHQNEATLSCELTVARRELELLQYVEREHDRAEGLEQELAVARRNVETQTTLASKAGVETARTKQEAESRAASLESSLKEQSERTARLEGDLAAARRDVETQEAQLVGARDELSRLKQAAETGTVELARSKQKEHERAEVLARDLAMARSEVYAYEAQARKARDQAAEVGSATATTELALRKVAQDERERADRLQQDLATTRSELQKQTTLAESAGKDAAQMKLASANSAELKELLQKEREGAETLRHELATVRTQLNAYETQAKSTGNQVGSRGQMAEHQSGAPNSSLPQERVSAEQSHQEPALAPRKAVEPSPSVPTADVETVGRIAAPRAVEAGGKASDEAAQPTARGDMRANPEAAAKLVARANVLLGQGDIGSARTVLERAVDLGSAQASFLLAETYDPLILPKWGTYGTRGDANKARDLYARADAVGISEAKERFEALRH